MFPGLLFRNRGPPAETGDATKEIEGSPRERKEWKRERMKLGPAENMTIVVLKQLLKDKGIAFSSKAKKSELVQIFKLIQYSSW